MRMSKTRILVTRAFLPEDLKYVENGLRNIVGDCFEFILPEKYDDEGLQKYIGEADILFGPYISKELLSCTNSVGLIQIPWTGLDTFNFKAMDGYDIPVCNSHSNAAIVAEMCVALVIDLLKKISYHDRKMRIGNWNRDKKPLGLNSCMVSAQTICIIGYGNIGRRVGKLLGSFGAKIIAVTLNELNKQEVYQQYTGKQIVDAVKNATVVINALPLTEETKGIVNEELISKMMDGVYIVNISRAGVLDEDAVFDGLQNGKIAGFASDVWWNAPKRGETQSWPSTHNKFWKMDNVILSPHRAGFVEGALPHLDDAIINIGHFIKGEALINVIDVRSRY